MNQILTICFALATCALAAPPAPIAGKVVGVIDGDTLTLLTAEKAQEKIRLEGIDAPETKQAFGAKAKAALSKLVYGKQVIVRPNGKDRWKRTLGRVEVAGKDINLQMIRDGFAWHYAAYSKDGAPEGARVLKAPFRPAMTSRNPWHELASAPASPVAECREVGST